MKTLPGKKTAANTITVVRLISFLNRRIQSSRSDFLCADAFLFYMEIEKLLYSKSRSWHCSFFQRHILLSTRFISGLR